MKKTLFMSNALPPYVAGSPTLMRNLLTHFPQDSYVILHGKLNRIGIKTDESGSLNVPYYHFDIPNFFRKRDFKIGIPILAEYLIVPFLTLYGYYVVKKEKTEQIFSTFPYGYFMLAAFFVSKIANIPLYIYMHDFWEETRSHWLDIFLARIYEPIIFFNAKEVYTITPYSKAYYQKKYSIEPTVLLHSTDTSMLNGSLKVPEPHHIVNIIMIGGIYKMNKDSVIAFVSAIRKYPKRYKLTIYAPQTPESLSQLGINGPNIYYDFVPPDQIKGIIRKSDFVYLPLSFDGPWELEVHTVFPTRTLDYLVSGKPIILHAPKSCYTSVNAINEGWAYLIASKDEKKILNQIDHFINDKKLILGVIENSLKVAKKRDSRKIVEILFRDLK